MSEQEAVVNNTVSTEEQKNEQPASGEESKDLKENGTGEATTETNNATETEKTDPKEMRAVVLTGFGGLKSVKILKKPEPTLNEGEVLIKVKAW